MQASNCKCRVNHNHLLYYLEAVFAVAKVNKERFVVMQLVSGQTVGTLSNMREHLQVQS